MDIDIIPEEDPHVDLEIKDAHVIFNTVWEELEEELGHEGLRFPKEIILLGGAPGSGKGTQTDFITKARGLKCPPVVISSLLTSPEMEDIKNKGGMVGDREVITLLFKKIIEEPFRDGVILDGFPRTRVQVECMKLLGDRINNLYLEFRNSPLEKNFRRPTFHVMVLFVEEKTSVERQLYRGRQIEAHNREVKETGIGEIKELRDTDLSPEAAQKRYRVFKEKTWDALQSLKEIYHYHFINAEGSIQEVEENILNELQYQSLLELDPRTFECLRHIPLASEIILGARQELVKRLDEYSLEHNMLFTDVLKIIEQKFMPIVQRHALSGRAVVNSENTIFANPLAIAMVIDIFSERGYHAVVDKHVMQVPEKVDLQSGEICCFNKDIYRIQVTFKGSEIRRG